MVSDVDMKILAYDNADIANVSVTQDKQSHRMYMLVVNGRHPHPGIILGMGVTNERYYIVTSPFIGCAYSQNDPWATSTDIFTLPFRRCAWSVALYRIAL